MGKSFFWLMFANIKSFSPIFATITSVFTTITSILYGAGGVERNERVEMPVRGWCALRTKMMMRKANVGWSCDRRGAKVWLRSSSLSGPCKELSGNPRSLSSSKSGNQER